MRRARRSPWGTSPAAQQEPCQSHEALVVLRPGDCAEWFADDVVSVVYRAPA